jgi:hypothetical protein
MKLLTFIQQRLWLQLLIGLMLAGVVAVFVAAGTTEPITSYAECKEAGNPILETDPPICRAGSRNFTGTPLPVPPSSESVTSVPFELLVSGDTHAAIPAHGQEFINTQADWQRYWNITHSALPAIPPLIPVDFSQSSVVGVSLGRQNTSGYGIKITSITTGRTGTIVNLTESTPTITCTVAQVITDRYLIVRTAKLAEPVSFHITADKRHCP